MPYLRGDYYRGDYYRGDRGFFGDLLGGLKKLAGAAIGQIPIVGQAFQLASSGGPSAGSSDSRRSRRACAGPCRWRRARWECVIMGRKRFVGSDCPDCGEWTDPEEWCYVCRRCLYCCICAEDEFDADELGQDPEEALDYAPTDVARSSSRGRADGSGVRLVDHDDRQPG